MPKKKKTQFELTRGFAERVTLMWSEPLKLDTLKVFVHVLRRFCN